MTFLANVLKKPITLFVCMFLGVLTGIYGGSWVKILSIIGDVYIAFLQMCALPIVACAVIINLSKIFKKELSKIVKKWLFCTILSFIIASLLTLIVSFFLKNFLKPSVDTQLSFANMNMGNSVNSTFVELEFYPEGEYKVSNNEFSLYNFLINTIPKNIFSSLSSGDTIKIIFFFGVLSAMGAVSNKKQIGSLIDIAEEIYNSLSKFIDIILIFSPISFFCILAIEFSDPNKTNMIKSIIQLIFALYLTFVIMVAISFFIIAFRTKIPFKDHIKAIKKTFLITVGTRSCLASILTAVKDAKDGLKFDTDVVNLTLPVGISLAQSGGMISATMAAVYASIIYGANFNLKLVIGTIVGSFIYSLSFIGVPGIVAVNMLTSVLSPLSLPSDIITIVWLAMLPLIDPILTFQCVYTNMAITSLISRTNYNEEVKNS